MVRDDSRIVERIRGHCFVKGVLQFLVKWKDLPLQDCWISWSKLDDCEEVLSVYYSRIGHIPPTYAKDGKCPGCNKFCHVINFH